jgi:heme-degrading monooxygenase HmoA
MFAVIFRAEIKALDDNYAATALRLRTLAMDQYQCIEFVSCTEGNSELAVSYWPSREAIMAWRDDPEHRTAQQLGKSRWYSTYQVDIVEVLRHTDSAS